MAKERFKVYLFNEEIIDDVIAKIPDGTIRKIKIITIYDTRLKDEAQQKVKVIIESEEKKESREYQINNKGSHWYGLYEPLGIIISRLTDIDRKMKLKVKRETKPCLAVITEIKFK